MNILVAGASGLIGGVLMQSLAALGHAPIALRRGAAQMPPCWDVGQKVVELGSCPSFDAIVNLAGENIATGCWTSARKERIRSSRVEGTRLLAEFFAKADYKPRVMISASAVGIYGDRDDEELTEESSLGSGFLADVAKEWESAAEPAVQAGIRVVNARLGIVLSPDGGALAKMLPPFRLGLGGAMGNGQQWTSWISIHELPLIFDHLVRHDELSGPVNLTAPNPATSRQFAAVLARTLNRPALLPVPSFLIKLLFGEMGQELLLASARVRPARLLESGYVFKEPNLDAALKGILVQCS